MVTKLTLTNMKVATMMMIIIWTQSEYIYIYMSECDCVSHTLLPCLSLCFLCAAVTKMCHHGHEMATSEKAASHLPFVQHTLFCAMYHLRSKRKFSIEHIIHATGCVVCEVWLRLKNTLSCHHTIKHNTSRRQQSKI
jgi:hypothetical protein